MSDTQPVLKVDELGVSLNSGVPVIDSVSLSLGAGQILGLVGESGSGKSTLAIAILGYARPGARFSAGTVDVCGTTTSAAPAKALPDLRRRLVSYVPQDPATSLNPSLRVGAQLLDRVRDRPAAERQELLTRALQDAQLPSTTDFQRRFPHQLSGGQQQRVLIAMAIIARPPLIILDEPTTGLDVVVQARILEQIAGLRDEAGMTMVYVSHDLAAVGSVADRIAVMYAGRIVEEGPAAEVLRRPRHPYTAGLLESVLDHTDPRPHPGIPGTALGIGEWPPGCPFEPRCSQRTDACRTVLPQLEPVGAHHAVRCLHWRQTQLKTGAVPVATASRAADAATVITVAGLSAEHRSRDSVVVAAKDISFRVRKGECVALLGESGSGKTTIARCIAGLHQPSAGTIELHGQPLAPLANRRDRDARRLVQIIFQNPYESLNPRRTIGQEVQRPAQVLRRLSASDARVEASNALERVRIPKRLEGRYPADLSGGERQRVAIARAMVAAPEVLICDEVTSALDVSVQAAVLDLLEDLRAQLGLSMLFITHDLGVVAEIADAVLILDAGEICERGTTSTVLSDPQHEYTRTLVSAAPHLAGSAAPPRT